MRYDLKIFNRLHRSEEKKLRDTFPIPDRKVHGDLAAVTTHMQIFAKDYSESVSTAVMSRLAVGCFDRLSLLNPELFPSQPDIVDESRAVQSFGHFLPRRMIVWSCHCESAWTREALSMTHR